MGVSYLKINEFEYVFLLFSNFSYTIHVFDLFPSMMISKLTHSHFLYQTSISPNSKIKLATPHLFGKTFLFLTCQFCVGSVFISRKTKSALKLRA